MNGNKLLRYWPVFSILAFIALATMLVASSSSAQAFAGDQSNALQATSPPPTVIVPTVVVPSAVVQTVVVTNNPPVTLVAPTVVIPNTGGTTVIVDLFSNWMLWAVFGVLLIILSIALLARPGPGGPDIHYHDDV